MIAVKRAVVHRRGDDGQRCRIDTPKSGRTRRVVIPPHIRAALDEHLERFVGPDPESLLFVPARGGCHVDGRVVRAAFRAACEAADVSGMRLHDLRHFAGTVTAQVSNLVETMERLGHRTPAASLRYQGQVSGRNVEIAESNGRVVYAEMTDPEKSSRSIFHAALGRGCPLVKCIIRVLLGNAGMSMVAS